MIFLYDFQKNILVTGLGYSVCPENWSIPKREDYIAEILLIIKGSMTLIHRGIKYQLQEHDFFFIDANSTNEFYTEQDQTCEFYWAHFKTDENFASVDEKYLDIILNNFEERYLFQKNKLHQFFDLELMNYPYIVFPHIYHVEENHDKIFSLLENSIEQRDHYNFLTPANINFNITQILLLVSNMYLLELQQLKEIRKLQSKPKLLIEIQNHIDHHFTQIHSIRNIADQYGISHQYLVKLFRQSLGITPIEYVNRLKINYAKDLMRTTSWNLNEIGYQSGFDNPYYFSRLFRQLEHESASAYRKRINFPNNQ
ncbi:MAG: AraC family transcriptional regulator [Massiliimalia sp.]|jgi:AraC-like DNA-binding protein